MGIRSKGNPSSSFLDNSANTGKEAENQPHPGGPVLATGGLVSQSPHNNRVWHIFTEPGSIELHHGTSISVLVVGGGGAGGANGGGGGGAGGIAWAPSVPTGIPAGGTLTPITATIIVGDGGSGYSNNAGDSGSPSSFNIRPHDTPPEAAPGPQYALVGRGGGGGGIPPNNPGSGPAPMLQQNGKPGGSGGGAGSSNPLATGATGGSTTQPSYNTGYPFPVTNYGNVGGDNPGSPSSLGEHSGGGGGGSRPGSSGTGEPATDFNGTDGGYGKPFQNQGFPGPDIVTGAPVPLRTTLDPSDPGTGPASNNVWSTTLTTLGLIAGGGGGGINYFENDAPVGGYGGGGPGGPAPFPTDPTAAIPGTSGVNYTGSGGGGGSGNNLGGTGGSGGKGIVIVTYVK